MKSLTDWPKVGDLSAAGFWVAGGDEEASSPFHALKASRPAALSCALPSVLSENEPSGPDCNSKPNRPRFKMSLMSIMLPSPWHA